MSQLAIKTCLMIVLCSLTVIAVADIYGYRDAEGRILLTDKPMSGQYVLVKHYRSTGQSHRSNDSLKKMAQRRSRLSPMIEQIARDQSLHPELLHAVVRAESAYNHKAVSHKGAVGLMQLMPITARSYGVSNSKDPEQNLSGGARHLRHLLGRFKNNLPLALAAYNAGETAVMKYGRRIPPFPETQNYVRKVLGFYAEGR